MAEQDNKHLLYMLQFFTEEARHQRTMMWETVKWFTPILTVIGGVWIKYYIDSYLVCRNNSIWIILFGLSILGLFLCACSGLLLRSFYRTNLKYISMFAKVEEELGFDLKERGDSKYFLGDRHITWEEWREERKRSKKRNDPENMEKGNSKQEKYTSEDYLRDKLPDKFWNRPFRKSSLSSLMQSVFLFFALIFLGSILLLIWNILT